MTRGCWSLFGGSSPAPALQGVGKGLELAWPYRNGDGSAHPTSREKSPDCSVAPSMPPQKMQGGSACYGWLLLREDADIPAACQRQHITPAQGRDCPHETFVVVSTTVTTSGPREFPLRGLRWNHHLREGKAPQSRGKGMQRLQQERGGLAAEISNLSKLHQR